MPDFLDSHPSREQLDGLAHGTLPPKQRRRVVRHLLSGCKQCKEASAASWPFSVARDESLPEGREAEEGNPELDASLQRVLERVKKRQAELFLEREQAPRLWRELDSVEPSRRRLLLTNGERFHTLALCDYVLDRAHEAGFEDEKLAITLAEQAIVIAERVDPEVIGKRLARDLLGRSWAVLGNAKRIAGDLAGAEEALAIGGEWLAAGTGDPLEEARWLDLLASLRGAQREFSKALHLQNRAAGIYRRIGESHLQGRTLVGKAKIFDDMQEPAKAAETLHKALPLLDAEREPLVVLAAYHNLVHSLNELGRTEEAIALLRRARPLYDEVGGALNLLRLRWLEGKIERNRGNYLAACGTLQEVCDAFIERQMGYEAALVTLDLALTHLEAGNHFEVRRLAREAIPIFDGLGVRRESYAALLALREAAHRDLLSTALLKELYQRASQNSPADSIARS